MEQQTAQPTSLEVATRCALDILSNGWAATVWPDEQTGRWVGLSVKGGRAVVAQGPGPTAVLAHLHAEAMKTMPQIILPGQLGG